ncbi:thiol reductant ABC exporter subunit CydD [Actinomadura rupiterrae]|uniref:thiol reductant ABC exporter subunit CydD n=1 Tax=Actinomadura rupiterrae TaxID=559627 RepID=UPI0020A2795F|nr:thiol reductant ABC exporter subunit CydD [Actinomadura rupiterrae]MCP2341071.1 ATP-binding cassette subfamily C protein CydD [Actinomadura rupiterrae]
MRPDERRLLRHLPGARGHLAGSALAAAAGTALVLLQAELLAGIISGGVVHGDGARAQLVPLLLLAGVLVARAVVVRVRQAASHRAAARLKETLRGEVLAHTQRLGPGRLASRRTGEVVTALGRGADALDPYLTGYLPTLFAAALLPLCVLLRIAFADAASGLTVALTLPLVPLFGVLIGLHTRAAARRQWGLLARLGGHFLDVLTGLPTLRVFGRARAQAEFVAEAADAHRAVTVRVLRTAFLSALVLELVASFSVALVAVPIGIRLLDGSMDLRTGMLVLLLAPEAYLPLRAAGSRFHEAVEGIAVARRLFTLLDEPEPAPVEAPVVPLPSGAPALRLSDVVVRYPGRAVSALAGLDLSVEPGERVALIGPSGAGKSTILAVLLGLVAPSGGTVRIGDTDLAALDLAHWRGRLAWLPQRPHLFDGSVADNIRLGLPDATDEQVRDAASQAGADAFVTALPDGYDARLGDRGADLSGGQRQRLALARVFLRCATTDVGLLLLDEPGAHLDHDTETTMLDALRALMPGRTVLVVTHRPSTLAHVDRTVRIESGRATSGEPAGVPQWA